MSGTGSLKWQENSIMCQMVLIYHVKPENVEHGTRRVDKLHCFLWEPQLTPHLWILCSPRYFVFFLAIAYKRFVRGLASTVAYVLPP